MTFKIRKAGMDDQPLIRDALYLALFVPAGEPPWPYSIVDSPDLLKYHEGWGRTGDTGVIAEADEAFLGAAWARLFSESDTTYGYIDNNIPEMSISVKEDHRSNGLGGLLLADLLAALKALGYSAVSLSVQKANRAINFYQRNSFRIHEERETDFIMIRSL